MSEAKRVRLEMKDHFSSKDEGSEAEYFISFRQYLENLSQKLMTFNKEVVNFALLIDLQTQNDYFFADA